MIKNVISWLMWLSLVVLSCNVNAIPILQLGPDVSDTDAVYNTETDTWDLTFDASSFSFNAYNTGEKGLTAYLVFAATPMLTNTAIDYFDLTVSDGTNPALTLVESGVGSPPILDPNSLAPHDIFDTYYEIYALNFDGALTTVENTEPEGEGGGSADGYFENISVFFDILDSGVTGIHIDMFTIDGAWATAQEDRKLVTAFAPFSHDAQADIGLNEVVVIPVPPALWLFGSGLIGLIGVARRSY